MVLSDIKRQEYVRRLLLSRMRLLCQNGFFGLLLMHMRFAVDEQLDTAATDGERILFGVSFLDDLSDKELDFVMMHEVMHVALKHCFREEKRNHTLFNIACDIVVNSNIMHACGDREESITLAKYGVAMHQTPTGAEGYNFTAEQVYAMLEKSLPKQLREALYWDDHSRWKEASHDEQLVNKWNKRVEDAIRTITVQDPSDARGLLPALFRRQLGVMRAGQLDWREILQNFLQEDPNDYSFAPPDRRQYDSPFFLPAYAESEERTQNILFMIDTSGSMSDDEVTVAFSEIKSAIAQFEGRLSGSLGFFDAAVAPPKPFTSDSELQLIHPIGGGGTDFDVVFEYVRTEMADDPPAYIIILTDGYAPFPDADAAMEIPVLWLITNDLVDPPFGKVARLKI